MFCRKFERCSANICPLDPDMRRRTWYPDEEICTRRKLREHPAVFAQRKLQKRWRKGNKTVRLTGVKKRLTCEESGLWTGEELMQIGEHLLRCREKRRARFGRARGGGKKDEEAA